MVLKQEVSYQDNPIARLPQIGLKGGAFYVKDPSRDSWSYNGDMSRPNRALTDRAGIYAKSLGLVLAATALSIPLRSVIEPVNLVMVYLAAVVVSAIYLGYGPSIVTSVAGVLAFDVFCVQPYLSFAIKDSEYALTFIALLGVGVTISSLTERLRVLTEESNELRLLRAKEELQAALLNSVSHELRTPLITIVGAL